MERPLHIRLLLHGSYHIPLPLFFDHTMDRHDSQIEMKDKATNRKFLKRTRLPSKLSHEDFTLGSYIVLLSRNLKIGNAN
jgi:hypothetical protein